MDDRQRLEAIVSVVCKYLPPDGIPIKDAMSEIISLVDPLPAPQPTQEPVACVMGTYGGMFVVAPLNPAMVLPVGMALYSASPNPAQEALYGMNQNDWKDVVAAISKVRDGRGIYLGCRPADVFQEWFLALGTAKVKEKNT